MNNKRKHIRVTHDHDIAVVAAEGRVACRSVNISSSGMQIKVNIPQTYHTFRSIIITIPAADKPLDIPCKLVRVEKISDVSEVVLGVEFKYEAEAQMALIENFIRDIKEKDLLKSYDASEVRQVPRTPCLITRVTSDRPEATIISIDNISPEGLMISYTGNLKSQDTIVLRMPLGNNEKHIECAGTVLYIIENYFKNIHTAGIALHNISEIDRVKISNFIVEVASSAVMKNLQRRFSLDGVDRQYQVVSKKKIHSLLSLVCREHIQLNVLSEKIMKMMVMPSLRIDTAHNEFVVSCPVHQESAPVNKHDALFCSFYLKGGTYYFKTSVVAVKKSELHCTLPALLYQSEKRSYERRSMSDQAALYISFDGTVEGQLKGTLVDVSQRGFLCEMPFNSTLKEILKPGNILRYFVDRELGLDTQGEVRHVSEIAMKGSNQTLMRVGVEVGVRRTPPAIKRYTAAQWNKQKIVYHTFQQASGKDLKSLIVKYPAAGNKHIVAFINYTQKHAIAPVVILPPAFGKKKEALAPLAATLITNFKRMNKDVVVVRYDGINRPGESFNEDMSPRRGYEMLHYRISQGMDDLHDTLKYVYNNPYFIPEKTILITFSMSALDARKLIITQHNYLIDYWISVMGVTSGQSVLSNITGGMDIIGNLKMNIPNGVAGLLGHLINLDTLARDIVDNRYAYVTDARSDMAKVSIPVTWIYGKYDSWVPHDEIGDIMSISSDKPRNVIEIPTGHNLRSSDDAIKTFMMITSLIHRFAYDAPTKVVGPDREHMVSLITYERERLAVPEMFQAESYWKEYLIGTKDNAFGYDFYRNMKEFKDFLNCESSLIDFQDGETIADMGCGTGLFIEHALQYVLSSGRRLSQAQVTLVDLVPEALEKAKNKIEHIQAHYADRMPHDIQYIQKNLDPNRLIPLTLFINDSGKDLNFLRNQVEGLKNITIDHLLHNATRELYSFLRGTPITSKADSFLRAHFNTDETVIIRDINRAVRFIKKELTPDDIKPDMRSSFSAFLTDADYDRLKTSQLIFEKLSFGDNTRELALPFPHNYFNKIVGSLFISYLFHPPDIIADFYRMLKPGGKILISSMKPDSDISVIFTNYIDKVQQFKLKDTDIKDRDTNLQAARSMLNEAASLFELEEDGYFRFYSADELVHMLESAGFTDIAVTASLGNPPQAIIVTGKKSSGK